MTSFTFIKMEKQLNLFTAVRSAFSFLKKNSICLPLYLLPSSALGVIPRRLITRRRQYRVYCAAAHRSRKNTPDYIKVEIKKSFTRRKETKDAMMWPGLVFERDIKQSR